MTEIGNIRQVREKYVSRSSTFNHPKGAGLQRPLIMGDRYLRQNGLTYSDHLIG